MKRAFSLFELIIVLVIISILATFIILKANSSIDASIKVKVKSDIALIRSSISRQNTKNILLQKDMSFTLDDANENKKGSLLFKNILDFPLVSTTSNIKEYGAWIKESSTKYLVYLSSDVFLRFEFENDFFDCKSKLKLCKEYE
jgi:prepilin-type N-terminal cleavage/methylation domain-containing protein